MANTIPFWTDPSQVGDPAFLTRPGSWDTMLIGAAPGAVPMPGIVDIVCHKEQRLDHGHGPGTDGAQSTLLGFKVAPIEIKVTIWTQDQMDRFMNLLPTLATFRSIPQQQTLPTPPSPGDPAFSQKEAAFIKAVNAPPPPNKLVQKPIDVQHPALQLLKITSLIVHTVTPFRPVPGVPDARFAILKCEEYLKPRKGSINTPKGSAAGISKLPSALQLGQDPGSDPTTDPSVTESYPQPHGATGSF